MGRKISTTMATTDPTRDLSLFSISQDESMQQLDTTKRCLFPEEVDSYPARNTKEFVENGCNEVPVDCTDRNISSEQSDLTEQNRTPTSVVSVWSVGHTSPTRNVKKSFGCIQHEVRFRFDETNYPRRNTNGVEEQTVIEVQYVEPKNRELESNNEYSITPRRNRIALNDMTNTTSTFRDAVRAKPLLDIEKTPTPLKSPKKKMYICDSSDSYLPECSNNVERTITWFLEDSNPDLSFKICSDWQAWSYFGFGRPGAESYNRSEHTPSKENIRSILRRRTSHSLRLRKSNVKNIKQNLAPFGHSPARSPARALLRRNRSFSVSEHYSAIVRVSKDKKASRKSFTDVLKVCTMFENTALDSPDLERKTSSYHFADGDLCYDSDPEDFARRRPIPSPASVNVDNSVVLDESFNYKQFHTCHQLPSRASFLTQNDETFTTIVQELFNQTTTLVLHPRIESNFNATFGESKTVLQSSSRRPIAVEAWLERGQHLASALVQPKWIWKVKPRKHEGISSHQQICLDGIELLDITRILKMEDTDRNHCYSFAKPRHCFFLKSIHDEELCFEAKSEKERDRIVSSLKLSIARFGAMVLTGDPQIYYEFFWMNGVGISPGQAPDFKIMP